MANDPNALRRYTQSYTYDPVGNLETVVHAPTGGIGWTRRYQYREDGNRLVATSAPGDSAGPLYTNSATYSHTYPHDEHGNFTAMPHLSAMAWEEADQLHHCTVGSQDVYFQYAGGVRVRKYVEHAGSTTEERIYLGPFELYRKHVNSVLKEEWESLHISDDTGRIVLVETHTVDDGNVVGSPTGIWRFQLSNHLGSAATEVTETGAIISYEEYHPYGTSAYRLVDSQIDVPAKRYRYTGMERDEETGLGYHTARYYAPWLGRWTASDPLDLGGGINRFKYTEAPVSKTDRSGTSPDVEPADTYGRTAVLHDANNQPVEGPNGITVIEFANEPLLTKEERNSARPRSALPVGTEVGPEYNEVVDIQAPGAVVAAGNPNDLLAVNVPLGRVGVDTILESRAASARWNAQWSEEKLVQRMNERGEMALAFMGTYLAVGVGGAFVIEGGIVPAPIFMNTGSASFATFEAAGHLSAGISTYAQGSTFAAFSVAAAESFFVADAVAHGLPLDVGMPGRGFGTKTPYGKNPRARFPNLFPEDAGAPGRVVRLGQESNGRWYEYGANGSRRRAQGHYDFIVQNREVWAVRQPARMMNARPGHLTLSGGDDVEYAGRVFFGGSRNQRGHIKMWDNGSGHYRPLSFYSESAPFPQHLFAPLKPDGSFPQPQHPRAN